MSTDNNANFEVKQPTLDEFRSQLRAADQMAKALARSEVLSPVELDALRIEARSHRDLFGYTQPKMAERCSEVAGKSISTKTYINFEQDKGKTTAHTAAAVRRAIDEDLGKHTNIDTKLADISVSEGLKRKMRLYPLERINWKEVADVIQRNNQIPIKLDISNEIDWLKEQTTKESIDLLQKGLKQLKKPVVREPDVVDEVADDDFWDEDFMAVIREAEKRQDRSRQFADSVRDDLIGRLYGAFVSGRFKTHEGKIFEASIFFLVLGASSGEDWSVQFTSSMDDALVERSIEFNEQKLTVN